jgi:hypothetical protein
MLLYMLLYSEPSEPSDITVWCFIKGRPCPFSVTLKPTMCVDDLKEKINEKSPLGDFASVFLWKVRYYFE